jgi:hypothetical protein
MNSSMYKDDTFCVLEGEFWTTDGHCSRRELGIHTEKLGDN